jgi:hypothetical protein
MGKIEYCIVLYYRLRVLHLVNSFIDNLCVGTRVMILPISTQ